MAEGRKILEIKISERIFAGRCEKENFYCIQEGFVDYKLFWGEMHTHTYCGNTIFGKIEDAVEIAKTHLDFWAPAEHHDNKEFNWERICRVARENNQPGKFIVFPGVERGDLAGDYNAYFLDDTVGTPALDSFRNLVDFVKSQRGRAIMIPHHTAYKVGCRGTNWNDIDESIMPLVEIFSMHGSSESEQGAFPMDLFWMAPRASAGTAQKGLATGKKFGFMASSDGHDAYPGCYRMGLIAAYAKELTRESLWDAFLKRRTYAVTGDRIILEFYIDGHFMGEEYKGGKKREIRAKITGDDLLDKIEIIKNNKILFRTNAVLNHEYEKHRNGKFKIRIEWGWGKNEIVRWEGMLRVEDGRILCAEPCFGPPAPNRILSLDERSCEWLSHTNAAYFFRWNSNRNGREGTNSIVFEIEGNIDTVLDIETNDKKFRYTIGQLMEGSRIEFVGTPPKGEEWSVPKLKIYEPVPESQYTSEVSFIDDTPENPLDFYYLRVTQANGQIAWSSPIWVSNSACTE